MHQQQINKITLNLRVTQTTATVPHVYHKSV